MPDTLPPATPDKPAIPGFSRVMGKLLTLGIKALEWFMRLRRRDGGAPRLLLLRESIALYECHQHTNHWHTAGDQKEIYEAGCQYREYQRNQAESRNGNGPYNKLFPAVPIDPEPVIFGLEGLGKTDSVGFIHRDVAANQRKTDPDKQECQRYIGNGSDEGKNSHILFPLYR